MPAADNFAKTRTHGEVRRAQILELRWQKRLAAATAVVIAAAWGAHAIYVMHHEHRWAKTDPLLGLVLMAALYARAAFRHDALVSMDDEPASASTRC